MSQRDEHAEGRDVRAEQRTVMTEQRVVMDDQRVVMSEQRKMKFLGMTKIGFVFGIVLVLLGNTVLLLLMLWLSRR